MRAAPGGGQLRTGNPGNKGGGRLPNRLKETLEAIRSDPMALKALLKASRNAKSPLARTVWAMAERYDPERPAEKVQHSGSVLEALLVASHSPPTTD